MEQPAPVLCKKDYYPRWQSGEFGNKLRSWASVADIPETIPTVTMRHINPSSQLTRYDVPRSQISQTAQDELGNYRFNESAPDDMLLAQGEIYYDYRGWHLLWSTAKTNMRQALNDRAYTAQGLRAREILRHFCCPSSYADIEALLELYPYHVIEFGCYARNLGDVPHRNTIIWEVRRY